MLEVSHGIGAALHVEVAEGAEEVLLLLSDQRKNVLGKPGGEGAERPEQVWDEDVRVVITKVDPLLLLNRITVIMKKWVVTTHALK